jgi:hypothetical protein
MAVCPSKMLMDFREFWKMAFDMSIFITSHFGILELLERYGVETQGTQ